MTDMDSKRATTTGKCI